MKRIGMVELKGRRSSEKERAASAVPKRAQTCPTRAQTRPSERMTGSYAQPRGNARAIKNDANHSTFA